MSITFRIFPSSFGTVGTCFLALAVLLSTGCASNGPKATATVEEVLAQSSASRQDIKDINDRLFASISSAPQSQDYILGAGDLIQMTVFETAELNTEARVGARGSITLPLLGPVDVIGLSAQEAEKKIEDLYRVKYLQNPHVNIFVKEQHGQKITLVGALKKPGTYDYPARRYLLDVLAMAEGLDEKAGRTIQVRRQGEDPARPSTFLVDLDELIKKGQTELNLEIRGGDVIFVPEAGMVYVDGAVRKPGAIPIKGKMSVQEAIVAAGGFSTTADEGAIKLVRYMGEGKREVISLTSKDMRQGAQSVELQDRDVVFVEVNKLEALVYGLRLNLLMGLVGIGYSPPPQ